MRIMRTTVRRAVLAMWRSVLRGSAVSPPPAVVVYQVKGEIGARAQVTYQTTAATVTEHVVLPWSTVLYDFRPGDELRVSGRHVTAQRQITAEILTKGTVVARVTSVEPSVPVTAQGVVPG